jgi:predicted DNA-binding transcriptional regulator YafY
MEALSAAGVPVYAIRGIRGGWQLDDEWRTRVPGLDDVELRAFLLAQPRIVGDARLAAAAERALNKLMAALPHALRQRAATMRQRLYIDTTGWNGTTENLAALPIVQDALTRDRKLELSYRRRDRVRATRVVDPLGLVAKGLTWYLVAHTPGGFRTFRVSRIEEARPLDVMCERPVDFDLATYWKTSTTEFLESRRRLCVTVRVEPQAAELLRQWCRPARIVTPTVPDAAGWTTLELDFEDEDQAAFMVLGFGPRIEVVAPDSLHDRIVRDIATAFERQRQRLPVSV